MRALKLQLNSEEKSHFINKFSLIIAVFFAGIAGYAYFAFIPLFLESKGFTDPQIIFVLLWMGVGMAVFSWFFGKISDKTGRRKLFFISALILQIVVFLLLNLNNHIIYFCILNFFRGSLLGMRMPASNALFADIVEKSNEKKEMDVTLGTIELTGTQLSLLSATKSTGWAIGVLGSSFVVTIFGVGSLILFLIITTAISLIFAIPIRDVKKEDSFTKESIENKEPKRKRAKVKTLLFITVFFRQFGLIPFLQIISRILKNADIPIGLAGFVIALNPILQVVAMVINGRIIDKPKISEKSMLAFGFILSALTLFCYSGGSATGNIFLFILGQICLGFAWGCIYTGAVKYIVNRAPLDRAFYMGIWITDLQIAKIISYNFFAFLWIVFFNNIAELSLPFAAIGPLIGLVLVYWL
ncbi:MAG: MFS transporter [Promethearchaeota archaeon]|jgi:MFS family permease